MKNCPVCDRNTEYTTKIVTHIYKDYPRDIEQPRKVLVAMKVFFLLKI